MSYKYIVAALLACLFVTFNASNSQAKEKKNEQDTPIVYAKHSFYREGKHVITTNYGYGDCNPINKEFEIIKVKKRIFKDDNIYVYDVEDHDKFYIINKESYTQKTIQEIHDRMFTATKINLSKYTPEIQKAIVNCKVVIGMTKDEVLLARGYPPVHKTLSLESNDWRYWGKRMRHGVVHFKNGEVVSIEEAVQPE